MEYNRTKKGLELSAAIIALVYCGLDLINELVNIISFFNYALSVSYNYTGYIIGLIIGLALVVTELILSIKIITTCSLEKYNEKIRIAFIIISSILVLFLLISLVTYMINTYGILAIFIFIASIVLESVALSIKNTKNNTATTQPTEPTIEDNINELKHLLELGVITQEQYESTAVNLVKKKM